MSTVSRSLPERPHPDIPKRLARELLNSCRAQETSGFERLRRQGKKFAGASADTIVAEVKLSDAQFVVAREYGFENWGQLKERIHSQTVTELLLKAVQVGDVEGAVRLLKRHPNLLHVPLWSGNWGPPMSHAANLGKLEMIKAFAALGARDFQHAFDRALLQGKLECAKWLLDHGVKLLPGIVMGACECLNPAGLGFLAELGAPFTDRNGDRLAPLSLTLETYGRNPTGKHEVLEIFERHGYEFPDTPIMAFHRGDRKRLEWFLRQDPGLLGRKFELIEIYPPELGCSKNGASGMHWTPIAGGTLLHLAIDFDEIEIFEALLEHGADVNARAEVDQDGYGGHTPIFNAIVSHGAHQGRMARRLLEKGIDIDARASLRKFLDWCEAPRWHEARDVSPWKWGNTFPQKGWVNLEVLEMVETR